MSLKSLWSKYNQKIDKIDCVREGRIAKNTLFNKKTPYSDKSLYLSPRAQSILSIFLPSACPITTGSYSPGVMNRCRIAEPLLRDFVKDKVLPLDIGCPFLKSCGLVSVWKP